VLVIGLGRFGSAIAITLESLGKDVLAVEKSPDLVAQWVGRVPLVEADATNPEALEQLGARDFGTAVVGVGSYLEASVLITGNLVDLGPQQTWAKAISNEHARILGRIGAHHVVQPEADAGARVAPFGVGQDARPHRGRGRVHDRQDDAAARDPGLHDRAEQGPRAVRRHDHRGQEPGPGLRLRGTGHPDLGPSPR
jgi:hypothetical protein